METKSTKEVIDEIERLGEKKQINLEIYDSLIEKLRNEDYYYTKSEYDTTMNELHSLVNKKLLSSTTFKSIEKILDENEKNHSNETRFIIKSIVSKSKERRVSSFRLTDPKKTVWITVLLGIFGWAYCLYNGNEECRRKSNFAFGIELTVVVAIIAVVVPLVLLF